MRNTSSTFPRHFVRLGLCLAVLAALLAFAVRAQAQQDSSPTFSVRPVVGALVATGDQRRSLRDAMLVGGQASYAAHPNVAVVGSLVWSGSEGRPSMQPGVDFLQYDIGLEGRLNDVTPRSSLVTRPYGAFGAGARTYALRRVPNASRQSNQMLYGATGLELAHAGGRFGLRFEARDNVTWFKGFRGELPELTARNDLQFSAGLTFGV